jgi:hypothetical protein
VKNLGPRFNAKLNFELPIAHLFDIVSYNSTYRQNIITSIDKWLTDRGYKNFCDGVLLAEIEAELDALRQEIKDWVIGFHNSYSVETEITLLPLIEKVKIFNDKIPDKYCDILRLDTKHKNTRDESKKSYDAELRRLNEIENANHELIDAIDGLNINLANHPTLIIQGEAGCGKSHLLGDIATQRKKQNLPTLLLLGTNFTNTTSIEQNILETLKLTIPFKDFIENLDSIGSQINSRVLILIDAINEGAGTDLWKNRIAGFINDIAKHRAVGLVLTVRSTYFHDIIPDDGLNSNSDITIRNHEGFKGNEYEALKLFCEHYQLKLPNFPILNPEFANPLLLHITCKTVKDSPDKSFPSGFNGVNKTYDLYKQWLNQKFGAKRQEYKYQDIASRAIDKLSLAIFNTQHHNLTMPEARNFFDVEFPGFRCLLSDLIEEGVLIKRRNEYDWENPKDVICFSFQRLGDYFMAKELLEQYNTQEDIQRAFVNDAKFLKITSECQWSCKGIVEAMSILLPEKYNLELFELIDFFIDGNRGGRSKEYLTSSFTQILSDSLKWRDVKTIDYGKITKWLEKHGRCIRYDTLLELTAIPNHPFNGDRLHEILMQYSMPKRDGFWQKQIGRCSEYADNKITLPLRRLIDWAWTDKVSYNTDAETARLVAQTLVWVLSSTDIALRDQTTKALVNLLEQQPEVLILTLKAFEKVDDLYILERLYAVAYGCILRTEKGDSIKIIAQYTYDTIFKDKNPPVHILLRDYARNVIEYAIYKSVKLDIDMKLIRPPYNSKMPVLPKKEEEVKEYKLDYDSPDFKRSYGHAHNAIYNSLIDGLADFGLYTVKSRVEQFASFSFREDDNYKIYLQTLNRAQRDVIVSFYKCVKLEVEFNKKYDHQNRRGLQWTDMQQRYIDRLNSIKKLCMNELDGLLNQAQINYVKETVLPYFYRKLKMENFNPYPIRYWIVKRVFELGYDRNLHGEYDCMAFSHSSRHADKIERIGKKYQWIAFSEILARLADNYELKNGWRGDTKYSFYKGAWQLSGRNIDPAFITRGTIDDDKNFVKQRNESWWDDMEYTHWNYPDSEWVKRQRI